jgi:hypothetical protein
MRPSSDLSIISIKQISQSTSTPPGAVATPTGTVCSFAVGQVSYAVIKLAVNATCACGSRARVANFGAGVVCLGAGVVPSTLLSTWRMAMCQMAATQDGALCCARAAPHAGNALPQAGDACPRRTANPASATKSFLPHLCAWACWGLGCVGIRLKTVSPDDATKLIPTVTVVHRQLPGPHCVEGWARLVKRTYRRVLARAKCKYQVQEPSRTSAHAHKR